MIVHGLPRLPALHKVTSMLAGMVRHGKPCGGGCRPGDRPDSYGPLARLPPPATTASAHKRDDLVSDSSLRRGSPSLFGNQPGKDGAPPKYSSPTSQPTLGGYLVLKEW